MIELLHGLGAEVDRIGTTTVRVHCRTITTDEPDAKLVGRLRGSVLLVGPLLARTGTARLAPPGGDFPARRTINAHLQALRSMGVTDESAELHELTAPSGLKPASIYLEEASVTGTETALLAAAAATGRTEIRHAACEPHVVELCEFLQAMGCRDLGCEDADDRDHRWDEARRGVEATPRRLYRGRKLGGGRRSDGRRYRGAGCRGV